MDHSRDTLSLTGLNGNNCQSVSQTLGGNCLSFTHTNIAGHNETFSHFVAITNKLRTPL